MPAPATVRRVTTGQKNTYPIVVMEHRVGFPRNPSSLCPLPTKLPKVPPRERVITVEKSLHRQMLIISTATTLLLSSAMH
jgi:hypothetical protein